jgi:thioredoxin reductase
MPSYPPASLAIIGAGPVGLEAALAALDHGLDPQVYEQGDVGSHPLAWGHVRMFTPWRMNLGKHSRAHLEAAGWTAPAPEELPSGLELVERCLQPLAALPELKDRIHAFTQVVQVGRHGLRRGEGDPDARRAHPFRLLLRDPGGRESLAHAAALMDLTGVYANPDWAGSGGIPARDEDYLRPEFAYHLEDVLGRDRERYAGRRTVVIGEGTFAATTLVALAQLADEADGTRVTWVTRSAAEGIFPGAEDDPLPARGGLRRRARALAAGGHAAVTHVGGAEVEAFDADPDTRSYRVRLEVAGEPRTEAADRVVVNVGFGPDDRIHRELDDDEPRFLALGHEPHGREPGVLLETGFRRVGDAVARLAADLAADTGA